MLYTNIILVFYYLLTIVLLIACGTFKDADSAPVWWIAFLISAGTALYHTGRVLFSREKKVTWRVSLFYILGTLCVLGALTILAMMFWFSMSG